MKNKIIKINELTDSRELLEKQLPRFIIVFIYIFLALLITFILWANFAEKEIVVKANGIVQAMDSNTIIPMVSGKIEKINVNEGDYVQSGQDLLVLDAQTVKLEEETLQENLEDIQEEINLSYMYEKSVNQGKNLFLKTNETEKEYYYKFQSYQNQLRQTNTNVDQEDIKIEELQFSVKELKNKVKNLQQQIQKLQENNASLKEESEQLKNQINEKQEELLVIQKDDKLSEEEKSNKISNIESEIEKLNTQISQNEIQIAENQQEIETSEIEIETIQANIKNNEQSIALSNSTTDTYEIQNDTYKSNELTQIQTQIKQMKDQENEYKTQLENNMLKLEDYTIKSKMEGYVHFINPVNEKDVIQAGTEIVKINTGEKDQLKIQLYLPSTDISNINNGQDVKIHSYSLPYREYGFIESQINSIDIDASVTPDNSTSYYKAEILVENQALIASDGKEAYLKTGMPVEGLIITQKKSYLQIFLEKLNLWLNG